MKKQMKKVVIGKSGDYKLLGQVVADNHGVIRVIRILKGYGYHLNQSDANGQGYNLNRYIDERLRGNIAGVGKMLTRNSGNPVLFIFDNNVTDFEAERIKLTESLNAEKEAAKAYMKVLNEDKK